MLLGYHLTAVLNLNADAICRVSPVLFDDQFLLQTNKFKQLKLHITDCYRTGVKDVRIVHMGMWTSARCRVSFPVCDH